MVQASVNRVQPLSVTNAAADTLRANGIEKLNVDLIVGLPFQTETGVVRSVAAAVGSLQPDRVSVFAYAHVPWMKRHQRLIDEAALPATAERLVQTRAAERTLVELGYIPIGLDHFARPDDHLAQAARAGTVRRNFQGYVTDQAEALIGIGASAISSMPLGYSQNTARVPEYRKSIAAGDFVVNRGVVLTRDDYVRREIIERLMCDLSVDLADVSRRWHVAQQEFDPAITALMPIVEDGLVRVTGTRVEIDAAARSVVRSVCTAFDAYLIPSSARHAAGI